MSAAASSGSALRAFAGSAVAIAVAGLVALATKPDAPESSPRNTLIGHAVALLAGYGCLVACGLAGAPSVLQGGVSAARVVAAAGSLAVTALVLVVLRASHPPAGATTLIVSLGLLRTPSQLVVAACAVVLLTAVDRLFDRLAGQRMPVWSTASGVPAERMEGDSDGRPDR
jgi:hypothetical protein